MSDAIHRQPAFSDPLLLAARLLIALLFVLFGWDKLIDFPNTIGLMQQEGAPLAPLAAAIAVVMEVPVAIAIAAGAFTRPLVLLMALYTLGTALIGHHYWTMTGADHYANEINFYKNLAIIGGLFAVYVAGPGRLSVDTLRAARRSAPTP